MKSLKQARPALALSSGSPREGLVRIMEARPRVGLQAVWSTDCWRVQIRWPNGAVHHACRFQTEHEAVSWIERHRWLETPSSPPPFDQVGRRRRRIRHSLNSD